jgi:hypothetical protein
VGAPAPMSAPQQRSASGSRFESVVCPRLLGEVRRGLTRPYFLERIDPADAERAVRELARANRRASCDLLDHPGLNPPALTVRAACDLLEL